METPDLAAEKLAAFEDLFPGVIADGVLDAARLGELLDTAVATHSRRPGTVRADVGGKAGGSEVAAGAEPRRAAPRVRQVSDFDDAGHVFIEGDNLEVLKLLQKAYNDQVKLIYIDPPYNTGNDFIYPDDFSDTLTAYLEFTGQLDAEGNRTSADAEILGRRHSRWLSMMYPRLVLARNLLTQDGVIFVSIDDNELPRLLMILYEVFGEENHAATFVWQKKKSHPSSTPP